MTTTKTTTEKKPKPKPKPKPKSNFKFKATLRTEVPVNIFPTGTDVVAIQKAIEEVVEEVAYAVRKFPKYHSSHEGAAIILEEVDEFWDEVKKNNRPKAEAEAVQIAATAIRFLCQQ